MLTFSFGHWPARSGAPIDRWNRTHERVAPHNAVAGRRSWRIRRASEGPPAGGTVEVAASRRVCNVFTGHWPRDCTRGSGVGIGMGCGRNGRGECTIGWAARTVTPARIGRCRARGQRPADEGRTVRGSGPGHFDGGGGWESRLPCLSRSRSLGVGWAKQMDGRAAAGEEAVWISHVAATTSLPSTD